MVGSCVTYYLDILSGSFSKVYAINLTITYENIFYMGLKIGYQITSFTKVWYRTIFVWVIGIYNAIIILFRYLEHIIHFEPLHDRTREITWAPSIDLDQQGNPKNLLCTQCV